MSRHKPGKDSRALVTETARLVVDEGFSIGRALERAAVKQGVRLDKKRPTHDELNDSVREYRALFYPEQQDALATKRQMALDAMRSLESFAPRLIGSLVDANGPFDQISLLLQTESAELVIHELEDRHIPWRTAEHLLHHASGQVAAHPALRFEAGESSIELVIVTPRFRSDPPRDPVDRNRPLPMLGIAELAALVSLPA